MIATVLPTPYKGWTYSQEILEDEDTRKIIHHALKLEGKEAPATPWAENGSTSFVMDWSPYNVPDQKDWQLWIDLGMPGRMGNAPLNASSLLIIVDHIKDFDEATQRDYKG